MLLLVAMVCSTSRPKVTMWTPLLLLISCNVLFIGGNVLDIVTRNSNNFLFKGQMVNETNLHEFLDQHEREFIFGDNIDNYSYKLINVIRRSRLKRSTADNDKVSLNLRIDKDRSRPVTLSIEKTTNLIDDNFVFIERYDESGNATKILDNQQLLENISDCFYRNENAALDLCENNQVQGIIRYKQEEFLIFPLPERFGKKGVHILIPSTRSQYQLIHNGDDLLARKRRAIPGPFSTDNGNKNATKPHVLHIETAIFVDKDLFRHMAKNYPKNTETHLIRFVLAMINGVQLLYHHPSLGKEVNFVLKRLEILHKDPKDLRRSSDIDVFLNSFCQWQRKFNPSSDSEAMHFDHAVILTGLDLYVVSKNGKVSSQVVGLAPVAGMCTPTSSCTINEGKHFESVFVVAHEIGHNLGMRHDTAENNCDPSSYIMSPTLGSGKITWSQCSRDYLDKFLDSSQAHCMFDRGQFGNSLDHSAEGLLPGERFDADQQCMLKYGKDSVRSFSQAFEDICRDLHCQRERYTWTSHPALEGTYCGDSRWCRSGVCTVRSLEPYSHTRQIISTKHLQKSNLVSDHKFGSIKQELTNTKKLSIWTDWSDPTECESGCLYGESGRLKEGSTGLKMYTRSCTDYRLNRKKCFGQNRKYETCIAKQCYNIQRTTVLEFARQICERAKEFDSEITGTGVQDVTVDPDDACKVYCKTRVGQTKSKGWTFPDGTICRVKGTDFDDDYFCANGRCEQFSCDNSTGNLFKLNAAFCPQSLIVEGTEHVTITANLVQQENGRDYKRVDAEEFYVENTTSAANKVRRNFEYSAESTTLSNNAIKPSAYNHWRLWDARPQQERLNHWDIKSGCHFSCIDSARGVQILSSRHSSATNIQLCQPDAVLCEKVKTTVDYSTNLCSRYMLKVRGLSGKGMQISPSVEDPDRSCKIACQDEQISHRYYLVNGDQGHFPFGTKCSKTEGRYCIRGRCIEFGVDDMPIMDSQIAINFNRNLLVPYYPHRRRRRSFLYYPMVNVTEFIDQRLMNELLSNFQLSREDYYDEDAIDMNNPIIAEEMTFF